MTIEEFLYTKLKNKLAVPIYTQEPEMKPDSYVLFEKTSGGERHTLKTSTIAFQSYGKSLHEAMTLNQSLKLKVLGLIANDEIVSIDLNSDYNFTDTETKRYRYQAVFDIKHY